MHFLRWDDLILINEQTVQRHGGQFVPPENLLNADRLRYAIDIVQETVFGERIHKTLPEIAAAYMFYIVTGHVFQDGNKRTGLEAALLFLGLNKHRLKARLTSVTLEHKGIPNTAATGNWILFELTMELAAGQISFDELKAWFTLNSEVVKSVY